MAPGGSRWSAFGTAFVLLLTGMTAPALGDSGGLLIEYSVQPAVGVSTRVASSSDFSYPRLAVDRSPLSPSEGTIYVLGLTGNITCSSIVTLRSTDDGRTFGLPRTAFGQCLRGPTLDVVILADGSLLVATWGPEVLRSTDGGDSWRFLATLDDAPAQPSLAFDPLLRRVYLAWGLPTDAAADAWGAVRFSRSWNSGDTWTVPVDVASPERGAAPQVAGRNGTVIVTWISAGSSSPFIVSRLSTDDGSTWSETRSVSEGTPCMRWAAPSASVARDGTFGISWYQEPGSTNPSGCWDEWGGRTETYVALSRDGSNFTRALAGGPPGWATVGYGDALVFDDAARPYVAWHTIAPNWTSASVFVAVGRPSADRFVSGSFSTVLAVSGGNSTAQENLAVGSNGRVYVVWVVVSYPNPSDPGAGIYLAEVTGSLIIEVGDSVSGIATVNFQEPSANLSFSTQVVSGSPSVFTRLAPGVYQMNVSTSQASQSVDELPIPPWGTVEVFIRRADLTPWWPLAAVVGVVVAATLAFLLFPVRARRRRRRKP